MNYVYIVRGQDFYGNNYALGVFSNESQAQQVCDKMESFAKWQQLLDNSMEHSDAVDLPECPDIPEQLAKDFMWECFWIEQLPLCKTIEDCDLY